MKADKEAPTVQYGLLTWGPCVLQIKISEEFQKKLLDEAQSSRKESLSYRDKLAGVIKEEYSYQNKEMFLPEISQILGVYDQAFQKWKNTPYEKKPEYVLTSMWVNFMKKHEYNPPHDHADQLSFVIFLDVIMDCSRRLLVVFGLLLFSRRRFRIRVARGLFDNLSYKTIK